MKEAEAMPLARTPTRGRPSPRLWIKLSVATGNLVQGAGLLGGAALLVVAAHLPGPYAKARRALRAAGKP